MGNATGYYPRANVIHCYVNPEYILFSAPLMLFYDTIPSCYSLSFYIFCYILYICELKLWSVLSIKRQKENAMQHAYPLSCVFLMKSD